MADTLGVALNIPYGDFKDPNVQIWSNVAFADTYYQTPAAPAGVTATPNGRPLDPTPDPDPSNPEAAPTFSRAQSTADIDLLLGHNQAQTTMAGFGFEDFGGTGAGATQPRVAVVRRHHQHRRARVPGHADLAQCRRRRAGDRDLQRGAAARRLQQQALVFEQPVQDHRRAGRQLPADADQRADRHSRGHHQRLVLQRGRRWRGLSARPQRRQGRRHDRQHRIHPRQRGVEGRRRAQRLQRRLRARAAPVAVRARHRRGRRQVPLPAVLRAARLVLPRRRGLPAGDRLPDRLVHAAGLRLHRAVRRRDRLQDAGPGTGEEILRLGCGQGAGHGRRAPEVQVLRPAEAAEHALRARDQRRGLRQDLREALEQQRAGDEGGRVQRQGLRPAGQHLRPAGRAQDRRLRARQLRGLGGQLLPVRPREEGRDPEVARRLQGLAGQRRRQAAGGHGQAAQRLRAADGRRRRAEGRVLRRGLGAGARGRQGADRQAVRRADRVRHHHPQPAGRAGGQALPGLRHPAPILFTDNGRSISFDAMGVDRRRVKVAVDHRLPAEPHLLDGGARQLEGQGRHAVADQSKDFNKIGSFLQFSMDDNPASTRWAASAS